MKESAGIGGEKAHRAHIHAGIYHEIGYLPVIGIQLTWSLPMINPPITAIPDQWEMFS